MILRALALAAIVTVCTGSACTREVVRIPGPVQYRDRLVIQPIPPALTQPHPIAVGPLSECPAVAAARRAELLACNADKAAIKGIAP